MPLMPAMRPVISRSRTAEAPIRAPPASDVQGVKSVGVMRDPGAILRGWSRRCHLLEWLRFGSKLVLHAEGGLKLIHADLDRMRRIAEARQLATGDALLRCVEPRELDRPGIVDLVLEACRDVVLDHGGGQD